MQNEINRLGSLAIQQLNAGYTQEAKINILKILEINPNEPNALKIYSHILLSSNALHEAIKVLIHLSKINSDDPEIFFNLGKAYFDIENYQDALIYFEKNISLSSPTPEVLVDMGTSFRHLSRHKDSLDYFKKALKLRKDFIPALNNAAISLIELKDFQGALEFVDQALKVAPNDASILTNRGCILINLRRHDEAVETLKKALGISPNFLEALVNLGNVQVFKRNISDALSIYKKITEIEPHNVENWINLGSTLSKSREYSQAQIAFDNGSAIDSDYKYLLGQRLQMRSFLCRWDTTYYELIKKISNSSIYNLFEPFQHLHYHDNQLIHLNAASSFAETFFSPKNDLTSPNAICKKKFRIAYFSPDFRNHPVACLTAELFELHDKNRFEIVAFSSGADDGSPMRSRLKEAFSQFIEIGNMSDLEVAKLSRKLEIDIAVDLGGYTNDSRTGVFAYRAAPVQINYLGYPGTMGVEYMDYIIADKTLIPDAERPFYSEKIIYMPDSYQANDRKRIISDKPFTRQELGLPDQAFVFCCFNNSYKILPATFDGWMRILKSVEGSVLWLFEDNALATENLKLEASIRGIDSGRLVFAKRAPLPDHLARHSQADIFLDTWPYNAHTTASDALWAGLPILTLIGRSFASRVAASLLNAVGLPELITTSQDQYEALAIELATNPDKLGSIRRKLAQNRLSSPLFDTPVFVKNLETAYVKVFEGAVRGENLEDITIG